MLKVAYSPIYKYELPAGHRFPMIKYELLPEQLIREGTIAESQFFKPTFLNDAALLLTHTPEYIRKLSFLPLSAKEERAIGFPVRQDLIQRGRYIAGGTFECAKYALSHGIAMNIAGGTHHAFATHGEGFCILNDIAISANLLLDEGLVKKILIIDLDVHQGNGTAHIFRNNYQVYTISVHGERNYPLRKQASDLDIGLPDGIEDKYYLEKLKKTIPTKICEFEPDLIFYLAGVDILDVDKLGRLSISKKGCRQRDHYILNLCKQNNVPVAVSMGGGYAHRLSDILEAHANTFRVAQEMYF